MSCIEYVGVEIEESAIEKKSEAQITKPRVVSGARAFLGDKVARRAEEVLDVQLAQGSMPA